jgi:hypothetical protein
MNGSNLLASAALGYVPTTWTVVGTGDFDGNGMADILWRDNLGNTAIWFHQCSGGGVNCWDRKHPELLVGRRNR